MAHVIPFHGTLYNPATVGDVRQVVAPPYDIIDATLQKTLHDRHPNNVIRLELGYEQPGDTPADNKYLRAAGALKEWLKSGALRRDDKPAIYYHTIEYQPPYSAPGTPTKVFKGFLSTVELEEFGSGKIYPHENTRAAAKTDRFNLLEACRANFSAIISLYSDPQNDVLTLIEQSIASDKPRIDFQDDVGFRQRLWSVTDPAVLAKVVEIMHTKQLFIADGHHRYETALNYRRARRQQAGAPSGPQPYDHVLMLFASLEDKGLTVLPTHRVLTTAVPASKELLRMLDPVFEVSTLPFQANNEAQVRGQFIETLRSRGQSVPMFGLALKNDPQYYLLTLRAAHRPTASASPRDRLDVSLLQQHVVATLCPTQQEQEAMLYSKDDHEALNWVRQGTGTAALLLNPTKVAEVKAVASAGERMPHKSTYFFPKPLTGLVMNVMEG
ncbi:conserved protein of unknown function DUF1015 [Nitrospira defluvii]|jgi:uncharacterized protein (DUF1015 family)|uniref:DUF1015 domain-containing protein n=1 Tax=Nitrospira defluvii TaxID=330214 RepID=D8PII5_9BACT|nr:conserved protein of unknown function DUF1015 [Nitrospira defluvii]